VLMNLLAALAWAGVTYMGTVHGVYRSAQTLVACLLGGVIAFGLLGPATAFLPTDNPKSIWYFAADPFCLWILFCAAFLVLRTLGEKLKNEPQFSPILDAVGGGVAGAVTGYLTVGLCLLLVQMLPTSPEFLGYDAFPYPPGQQRATGTPDPGPTLWLKWDRATLEFFNYLTSKPFGSAESSLLARCGDVYPPAEKRGPAYGKDAQGNPLPLAVLLSPDDFLYYYWHRRHEFIQWQTGVASGPIPERARPRTEGPGLPLVTGQIGVLSEVSVRIVRFDRMVSIEAFPQERPPGGEEFLVMTLRFRPTARLPRAIDSSQFFLLGTRGERFRDPLLYGRAKPGKPENQIVPDYAIPSALAPRGVRFNMPPGKPEGNYLASGAVFTFSESNQEEARTFVFTVPKQAQLPNELLRLNVLPTPPAASAPAAPPAAATPAPAETKPAAPRPAATPPAATAPAPPAAPPAAATPATPPASPPSGATPATPPAAKPVN